MNKLLIGLLLVVAGMIAAPIGRQLLTGAAQNTKADGAYEAKTIPSTVDALQTASAEINKNVNKIITLEDRNVVVFRGAVTGDTVGAAMRELQQKSRELSKDTEIYLVIDSPGGSIMDGSASMAFQFVQSFNQRLVARNGILMSHRAALSGLSGQLDGELESRYKMIKRKVDYLDMMASSRMDMKLTDYKQMILPEYWVHGFDAVSQKAADQEVLLRCGSTMDGSRVQTFQTIFGAVDVTFSKCPLMREPEKIEMANNANSKRLRGLIHEMISSQRSFVEKYIVTDEFSKIFK